LRIHLKTLGEDHCMLLCIRNTDAVADIPTSPTRPPHSPPKEYLYARGLEGN